MTKAQAQGLAYTLTAIYLLIMYSVSPDTHVILILSAINIVIGVLRLHAGGNDAK